MPNAEEYQREKIQKLKRKQLSAREIAEKVGVPISFVYKVTTGKRFKTSLHKYRVELGIEKLNNAAVAGKLASNALAMLAADPAVIDAKGCDACTPLHFSRWSRRPRNAGATWPVG